MNEIWLVRSTFAKKDEALLVASGLLEQKLIACANISGEITSVFRWEGKIQQEQEVVLLVKTTKDKAETVVNALKTLHGYQIPSILAWPASLANADFLAWVEQEMC